MESRDFASDYYLVCESNHILHDTDGIQPLDLPARSIEVLGNDPHEYARNSMRTTFADPGRLQVFFKQEDDIYEIQILRLREQVQSEIAKSNGDLEVFALEDGDYLAESASALFDPLTHIFVLQRNYFGANSNFVKEYLNNLLHNEPTDQIVQLLPIINHPIDLNRILSRQIKAFSGKVVFEGEPLHIYNDILHFSRYRPAVVDISVRASRSREQYLDQAAAAEQIRILKNDPSTKALTVKVEKIDRGVEEIDLLLDHIQDKYIVNNVDRSHPARHHEIYEQLKKAYLNRVEHSHEEYFRGRKEYLEHR